MENSLSWMVSALLGAAGAFILIGPTRSRIDRAAVPATWLLVFAAAVDLWLGARVFAVSPLAPWASFLVLLALARTRAVGSDLGPVRLSTDAPPRATMCEGIDDGWIRALGEIHDAVAVFEGRQRVLANPAWQGTFISTEDENRLLGPLLAKAEELGSLTDEKLDLPPASWARSDFSEPMDGRVSIHPLSRGSNNGSGNGLESPGPSRWLVTIPSRQARHLALFTRHTAHHFNNMLSAIVGGAGMAMDTVAEDSEMYRELVEIENMAMRAADLTGDLQQAAREVAPPEPAEP